MFFVLEIHTELLMEEMLRSWNLLRNDSDGVEEVSGVYITQYMSS